MLAVDLEPMALLKADSDEYGIETLQFTDPQIFSQPPVGENLDAHGTDFLDFPVQYLPGKPVFGYAEVEHAAYVVLGLENRRLVSKASEMICAGEASGAGADDRYFGVFDDLGFGHFKPFPHGPICDKPLQGLDGNPLIELSPVAIFLTGMVAHSSGDAGKGIFLENERISIQVSLLPDQRDESLDIDSNGALGYAGGGFFLFQWSIEGKGESKGRANMRARLAPHAFIEMEIGITDYELHDSDPHDHRQLYRIAPLGSIL